MLIVIGLAVAALIIGGVLEVKVHPERIAQVPGQVISFATQPTTQARARVLFTDLKRRGEQLIIKDESKRTKLTLLYVSQDSAKLQEMMSSADSSALLPQAELLADSITRMNKQLDAASLETVASLKEESREALASAQETLLALQKEKERYEGIQEKFSAVTAQIGESLGGLKPVQPGDVAGVQDKLTPTPPGDEPQFNAIPLNF